MGGVVGKVKPNATLKDCQKADAVVVVKRLAGFIDNVRRSGKPWVWDLVDFYPQPKCSTWNRDQSIKWVREQIKAAKPDGVIYANQRMKDDIGIDGAVIYHHAKETPVNPIREQIKTIGYEGSPRYLGRWRDCLVKECARRGWEFKDTGDLHEIDVVVAFRDGPFNGYAQSSWKSNVKLANAHRAGTPFIGQPEPGYTETATGHEIFIESPTQLTRALDSLTAYETRLRVHRAFLNNAIDVESVANQTREYVETLLRN